MFLIALCGFVSLGGCSDDDSEGGGGSRADVYGVANQCQSVEVDSADGAVWLARSGEGFVAAEGAAATPFFLKPSALGRYLLFDPEGGYLVSDGSALQRATELDSDITLVDDSFVSEAEWELLEAPTGQRDFLLRHYKTGGYLTAAGLDRDRDAADSIRLADSAGCAAFPEEQTHSEGALDTHRFEDGDLFGIADTHEHIFSNFGFGGGGMFHGAPYHPLGIEHALGDCEQFHGVDGRADLFGAGFDQFQSIDFEDFIVALASGLLPSANHATDGYPTFTDWPAAPFSATHQTQYHKWIERAYLAGLRLVVQHTTTNQVICDLLGNSGLQPIRYSCNDMVSTDRQIDEAYRMQDYIDAQEGGPGRGWFRIVTSPQQAREVIADGKLAVILGIEVSNLFDCFLVPPTGFDYCDESDVLERLEDYYDRGVRVIFPVHKFDNAFSAGDGQKGILEIGNIVQTGHFSNFTTDCDLSVPSVFDRGRAQFPGAIELRDDYFATPPNNFEEFYLDILGTLAPFLPRLLVPPVEVDNHCKVFGLTELGEYLVEQLMRKGMLIEVDHLPRNSYRRVFEILQANDYPPLGTHGLDNHGLVYALGGTSKSGFSSCRNPEQPATVDDGFQSKVARAVDNGGYPAMGIGFDLNGFAGAHGPRFGERSGCSSPQSDPVTYPFTSYAGDVTFHEPSVGSRELDFNTEGLVHIGMLAELIEDVRGDGVSDEELEPLFRSAEGYVRVWEKANRRGRELGESAE